jgi:hypothetical protein
VALEYQHSGGGNMGLKKKYVILVSIVAAMAVALALAGCAPSYTLDKDAYLSTEWGATAQYKVDGDWEEYKSTGTDLDSYARYDSEDSHDSVSITLYNPASNIYGILGHPTYSDWLEYEEETHTGDGHDDDSSNVHTSYSNYEAEEQDPMTIDGEEFRVYKITYTFTITTTGSSSSSSGSSSTTSSTNYEEYHAVIKDGLHDADISASSYQLLKDFAETTEIDWW